MIDQPDGILPIVTFDAQTSWQNLLTLAQPHLDRNGLGRLEAAVGKTARTVIWDGTRNPWEERGFLAVHYPEILILDWGSALNGEPNLLSFDLQGSVDYPLYRNNLTEIA